MADDHRRVGVCAPSAESDPLPDPPPCRGREKPCAALNFEAQLRRIKDALGAKTRLYLAARHAYRGDDRARIAALGATGNAHRHSPRRHRGRALSRAPPPPAAGRAHLHPREMHDCRGGLRGSKPMPSGTSSRRKEMARLFTGHEDALGRTIEIADACRFSLDELKYEYPDEPVPDGKTPQSHLEDLTWEGAAWRFPDGVPDKVRDTLEKELALIAELNYAPYFLTVHDIVAYAREPAASSARAAARPPIPPSAIASASPMSIRPRSISCSSASSRRSARSRPTSTSISSMSGARR